MPEMLHTSIALRTLIDTAPVRAPTTHRRTVYAMSTCKAVVLNEGKLNFDKKVQLDALATVAEISKHEDTTTEQVNSTDAVSPNRPLLMGTHVIPPMWWTGPGVSRCWSEWATAMCSSLRRCRCQHTSSSSFLPLCASSARLGQVQAGKVIRTRLNPLRAGKVVVESHVPYAPLAPNRSRLLIQPPYTVVALAPSVFILP